MEVLQQLRDIAGQRPTYGYRRLWALLRRQRRNQGQSPVSAKRVYRLAKQHKLLLQRYTGSPPMRVHDGKIALRNQTSDIAPTASSSAATMVRRFG